MARRWDDVALALLGLALFALLLVMRRQAMTGDEQRYILYAASLWRHGGFTMPVADWSALHMAANRVGIDDLPRGGDGAVLMHPVAMSALVAPVAALFPIDGPRFVSLVAGLGGLLALHRLCRDAAGRVPALLATAMAAFSIPLLPYLHLFAMESFVFALVAYGWWRVRRAGESAAGDVLTALVLVAIPFVHLRGSVVAAVLYGFLVWPSLVRRDAGRLALLAVPGAAGLGLLIAMNLAVYGVVTGPVNSARPPLPWGWIEVLPMQLFNVRHGLLAYAPVWILGMAGLIAGAVSGNRLARQGLLLALVAALTGVGVNPGECWPARFWVLSVPMLTVGLAFWISRERGWVMRVPGAVLVALTLANSAMFFADPNTFLDNRQTTVTYQLLFDRGLPLHFGLLLPVEIDQPAQVATVRAFLLGFGALLGFGVLAGLRPGWRWALPMVLVLAVGAELARVSAMPATGFALRQGDGGAEVTLAAPQPLRALQFGRGLEAWYLDQLQILAVRTTGADGGAQAAMGPANQVVPLRCAGALAAVALSSPTGLDVAGQTAFRLRLYAPESVLERWATRQGIAC
ncbi:hypothetical protein ACQW02_01340 [Humitalea sp. 24SJ18S-53]|uniref:hypothetical protein n=1 Tax=Humitalea sp. 24SJ18S-53 TaxID=3422307 RepID=UPI003D6652CA